MGRRKTLKPEDIYNALYSTGYITQEVYEENMSRFM